MTTSTLIENPESANLPSLEDLTEALKANSAERETICEKLRIELEQKLRAELKRNCRTK
jgi:hypothetical protein